MVFSENLPEKRIRRLLSRSFFHEEDVLSVAKNLLGKVLVTQFSGIETAGVIVETEAYRGADDRACHAYMNKRTKRTETMFRAGGHAYIYLCYGLHHLFNVVSGPEEVPDAVLIRAMEPVLGLDEMLRRRNLNRNQPKVSSGPACLSMALGIHKHMDGDRLWEKSGIWLEDWSFALDKDQIAADTRIGVSYAGSDALRPWRFFVKNNPWVSAYPKGLESV